jgi:serine/threonine protein kinase
MAKIRNMLFKKKASEEAVAAKIRSTQERSRAHTDSAGNLIVEEKNSAKPERKKEDNQYDQMTQDRIKRLELFKDIGKNPRSRSVNAPETNQHVYGRTSWDNRTGKTMNKIKRVAMFPSSDAEQMEKAIKKKWSSKKKKVKKEQLVKGEKFLIYDRYRVTGKMLGQGAYGAVCEAFDTKTQTQVAIKKNKDVFAELEDAKRILREIKLMAHFDHPDIVPLTGVIAVEDDEINTFQDAYLVMELMQVNLATVLQKQKLQDIHYKFFLYQMLRGLKYIHSAGVIHRDLKPENIMVNGVDCNLKITDFGLARGVCTEKDDANDNLLTEYVVTRWYRAPEIICSKMMYDEAVDEWAVGCIFAEFYLRKPLFRGKNQLDQLEVIFNILGSPKENELDWVLDPQAKKWIKRRKPTEGTEFSALFPRVGPNALGLLKELLLSDPTKRIRVRDALEHPFLKELHDPTPKTKAKMEKNGMKIGRETETTCPTFNISFEYEKTISTKFGIRHMMYKELRDFNEKASNRLKKKKKAKKKSVKTFREKKSND